MIRHCRYPRLTKSSTRRSIRDEQSPDGVDQNLQPASDGEWATRAAERACRLVQAKEPCPRECNMMSQYVRICS